MGHIRRFIFACSAMLSAFAADLSAIATSIFSPIVSLFGYFDYRPDAGVSLAVDRAAQFAASLTLPAIASRFKSFVARALRHDHFDGERFDPGRMPA